MGRNFQGGRRLFLLFALTLFSVLVNAACAIHTPPTTRPDVTPNYRIRVLSQRGYPMVGAMVVGSQTVEFKLLTVQNGEVSIFTEAAAIFITIHATGYTIAPRWVTPGNDILFIAYRLVRA